MGFLNNLSPWKLDDLIQKELSAGGKFETLKTPFPSFKNLNLIQFHKNIEGIGIVYGLGKSKSLKQAKIKAYFEFLERKALLMCKETSLNLTSSNGISAHKFELLARKSARDELFERDSFLAHWYTQQPFQEVALEKNIFYSELVNDLKKINFSMRIGLTNLGFQKTLSAFLLNEATGGFCIGTSSGKSFKADYLKAVLEGVINLTFGNYGKSTDAILTQLNQKGFNDLEMHRAYWLYKGNFPQWIFQKKTEKPRSPINLDPNVNYFLITTCPYPVVVAKSKLTLPFRAGLPGHIEQDLLTSRTKVSYVINETVPHPIF